MKMSLFLAVLCLIAWSATPAPGQIHQQHPSFAEGGGGIKIGRRRRRLGMSIRRRRPWKMTMLKTL